MREDVSGAGGRFQHAVHPRKVSQGDAVGVTLLREGTAVRVRVMRPCIDVNGARGSPLQAVVETEDVADELERRDLVPPGEAPGRHMRVRIHRVDAEPELVEKVAVEPRRVAMPVPDLRAEEVVEVRLVPGFPVVDVPVAERELLGEGAERDGIGIPRSGLALRRTLGPAGSAPHGDERRQSGRDRLVDLLVGLGPVVARARRLHAVPVEDDANIVRADSLDPLVRAAEVGERCVGLFDRRVQRMGGCGGGASANQGEKGATKSDGYSRLFTNPQCFVRRREAKGSRWSAPEGVCQPRGSR